MPFSVIRGTFHVTGYSPDGDSIRFAPADPSLLAGLSGPPAKINARGHVQLRIEAVDALETHYAPPSAGGNYHQPLGPARSARDALLQFAQIGNVTWNNAETTVVAANEGTPGYILTRAVEKNRRPIAFVYAGDPPEQDGASVILDTTRLAASFNYQALEQGLVYPTFYTGLFHDLRSALTAATVSARAASRGVHATDRTTLGVDLSDLSGVADVHPILPKLFRRIVEYMANFGTIDGFKAKMAEAAEPVMDVATANFSHFDNFIFQNGSIVGLTVLPETLVFDEMPATPVSPFSLAM